MLNLLLCPNRLAVDFFLPVLVLRHVKPTSNKWVIHDPLSHLILKNQFFLIIQNREASFFVELFMSIFEKSLLFSL